MVPGGGRLRRTARRRHAYRGTSRSVDRTASGETTVPTMAGLLRL
jgi:hypothetical protein